VCEKSALHIGCHGHMSDGTKIEHSLSLAQQQLIMTMTYEEITP